MKKRFLIIICSCMTIFSSYARDIQETVLKAHKLYEQGDFDKAIELYDSVEKKGPATWYNKGICHYKKGDYINSLICLKRAERTASWAELPNIHAMIDQVNKELNIKEEQSISYTLYRVVERYLSLLTLYGWQLIFLFTWILLLVFAARLARRRRYGSLTMLSAVVVMAAYALYMKHDICNTNYGIVVKDNVVVYAGPDKAFHELGFFTQAHEITICEHQEKWFKVRGGNFAGWVCDDSVAVV